MGVLVLEVICVCMGFVDVAGLGWSLRCSFRRGLGRCRVIVVASRRRRHG